VADGPSAAHLQGGLIELWGPAGPKQSQMLLDWYSASHLVHGFLFYGLLHLVAKRWKPGERLLAATLVEAAWEIVENSPVIIDRYREATIALGYRGDTVLNSVSDIAMMIAGFLVAARVPVWASVMIVLVLELVPLAIIRDNLTLNVWMLLSAQRRDAGVAGGGLRPRLPTRLHPLDVVEVPAHHRHRRCRDSAQLRHVAAAGIIVVQRQRLAMAQDLLAAVGRVEVGRARQLVQHRRMHRQHLHRHAKARRCAPRPSAGRWCWCDRGSSSPHASGSSLSRLR
jgi:hypothetical protein